MSEREPLTEEQREAALRDIRGPELGVIVKAAKLLSADSSTTTRLLELLASEERVEVRHGILYALSWHGDISLWDLMIRILADQKEHPKVRGQAAECISYCPTWTRSPRQGDEERQIAQACRPRASPLGEERD